MEDLINQAAQFLQTSKHTTVFTGAGISVESGIPSFRGPDGLWAKYDPAMLQITYFKRNPKTSWEAIKKLFYDMITAARPNAAHRAVAELETMGIVKAVITQNIDNLHQEAGSKVVYEFHGTVKTLICTRCGFISSSDDYDLLALPPSCKKCQGLIKPNFVFFGEPIPAAASMNSFSEATVADVFIVIGTSGEVMPACLIPVEAKKNGAKIIEINTIRSNYTDDITDIYLEGKAGEILPKIVENIKKAK